MRKQIQRGWVIHHSHTADTWQSQDANPCLSILSSVFFPLYRTKGYVFVPAFCGAPEGLLEIEEGEIKVRKSLILPGAMEKKDEGFLHGSLISWAPSTCQSPWLTRTCFQGKIYREAEALGPSFMQTPALGHECLQLTTQKHLKYPEFIYKRNLIEVFQIWQQP